MFVKSKLRHAYRRRLLLSKATGIHWWLSISSHKHWILWHHLTHIWWWEASCVQHLLLHHLHLHLLSCCLRWLHLKRWTRRERAWLVNPWHLRRYLITISLRMLDLLIPIYKIDRRQSWVLEERCLIFVVFKWSCRWILLSHHHTSCFQWARTILSKGTSTPARSYSHHLCVKTFFGIAVRGHAVLFVAKCLMWLISNLSTMLVTICQHMLVFVFFNIKLLFEVWQKSLVLSHVFHHSWTFIRLSLLSLNFLILISKIRRKIWS